MKSLAAVISKQTVVYILQVVFQCSIVCVQQWLVQALCETGDLLDFQNGEIKEAHLAGASVIVLNSPNV